jgi:uncharacterized protein (TIGR00251 family)
VSVPLTATHGVITFAVRVVPRAGRTGVAGTRGDALLVRLAAPPVDGAANEALIAFIADLFDRPARDVSIVAGQTSRDKRIAISGVTADAVSLKLESILSSAPRRP